jgi:hypothetical protein
MAAGADAAAVMMAAAVRNIDFMHFLPDSGRS